MIHRIYSDLTTFKELEFHPGLNILLSDKSSDSTDRQTRNRAGKSSLIEIVHLLAGADCNKDSIFKVNELIDHSFGMDFDLGSCRAVVERSGSSPSKVVCREYSPTEWPVSPRMNKKLGCNVMAIPEWRSVLGSLMFGLQRDDDSDEPRAFGPTFRSSFAYFVRRQSAGGFVSPFKQAEMQQPWDKQVAVSFLLGMDWTVPRQWQLVREREGTLKELKKAAGQGALGSMIGSSAELRTKLVVLEERCSRLQQSLAEFQLLPEYHELEQEASNLTRRLGELSDDNTVDCRLMAELEQATQAESPPSLDDLESLYKEAGVTLPQTAIRRFEDVRRFHESVIRNRESYLRGGMQAAAQRVESREQTMHDTDKRRAQIMAILRSHGALEEFSHMQSELSRHTAEMESTRQRYRAAQQLEGLRAELEMERGQLLIRLNQDFREQEPKLKSAILAFEEVSSSLYEDAGSGSLTISPSLNGPEFEVKIQGRKSKGISNMQIYCFDMMLMLLCAERGLGPGFLIHDSHMFDGVDARQIAKALQVGAAIADRVGFQYIVTMNSDTLAEEGFDKINLERYILPVRLMDATEDGGLFGIRFD